MNMSIEGTIPRNDLAHHTFEGKVVEVHKLDEDTSFVFVGLSPLTALINTVILESGRDLYDTGLRTKLDKTCVIGKRYLTIGDYCVLRRKHCELEP
jgi:hypothetical protein